MSRTDTWTLRAILVARSKITHMAGTQGNEALILREPVMTPTGVRLVPSLSGNALRHRLIREPLARHLIETWELDRLLDEYQLDFLFHGGALTEKGGREDLGLQQDVYRLIPLARVLGLNLPSTPIPGQLHMSMGVLFCRENISKLQTMFPVDWMEELDLRSAAEFVRKWQYTRGDVRCSTSPLLPDKSAKDETSQGIYAGESVVQNSIFGLEFHIRHVEPVVLGSLLFALNRWQTDNGTIGGQAAKGHGKFQMFLESPENNLNLIQQYTTIMASSKQEGVALLRRIFEKPEPRRGKKTLQAD